MQLYLRRDDEGTVVYLTAEKDAIPVSLCVSEAGRQACENSPQRRYMKAEAICVDE